MEGDEGGESKDGVGRRCGGYEQQWGRSVEEGKIWGEGATGFRGPGRSGAAEGGGSVTGPRAVTLQPLILQFAMSSLCCREVTLMSSFQEIIRFVKAHLETLITYLVHFFNT